MRENEDRSQQRPRRANKKSRTAKRKTANIEKRLDLNRNDSSASLSVSVAPRAFNVFVCVMCRYHNYLLEEYLILIWTALMLIAWLLHIKQQIYAKSNTINPVHFLCVCMCALTACLFVSLLVQPIAAGAEHFVFIIRFYLVGYNYTLSSLRALVWWAFLLSLLFTAAQRTFYCTS